MSALSQKLLSRLSLIAAFLVAGIQASAEDSKPVTTGPSSVWEVDQGGNHIYLAGTIHLLRDKDYPLPDVFEQAYKDSAKLIFELPPDSEGNGEVVQRMRKLGAYPPNENLSMHVGADTFKRLVAWADKNDFSLEVLTGYRPWFLSLIISNVEYQRVGATSDHGLDTYFEKLSAGDKKPGAGLESVEYQITLFTSLTAKMQEELLVQTLNELETMPKDFDELLTAWRSGDLDGLEKFLFRDADKFPALMQEFLTKRNKAWLGRVEQFLKNGDHVMVLVGAGHLCGKEGLLELLKQKGYSIKQLGK